MKRIAIYDTTLRDGAQGRGINFSPAGKLHIVQKLDEFGVDYIEGGYAASNVKDMSFFKEAARIPLRHARLAAFGSTRRAGITAAQDVGCQALMEAGTPVATIFGKSWRLHVRDVLRTTEEENLAMIADTVAFLRGLGKEVVYDAEHFFDGYKDSPGHALATLRAAVGAGASIVVLCDTNGGTMSHEVHGITREVITALGCPVGIHTHNDSELAVANSLEAVRAGAVQVQGTINGFGERTGNANLNSVMANLKLKLGCDCLRPDSLPRLKELSEFVCELANVAPDGRMPFVGQNAFSHKAGMHVDGVRKNASSFEHIAPEAVGNGRHILISELAGGSNVFLKAVELGIRIEKNSPEIVAIRRELERLEEAGYEFESAEASFHLLMRRVRREHQPYFKWEGFRVIAEKRDAAQAGMAEASVKIRVGERMEYTVAEGQGPVDALNTALRKALGVFFPAIASVSLTDYRVRILDPEANTSAKTRVIIESTDGHKTWSTVGVSDNILEASWEALVDSMEYKLLLDEQRAAAG